MGSPALARRSRVVEGFGPETRTQVHQSSLSRLSASIVSEKKRVRCVELVDRDIPDCAAYLFIQLYFPVEVLFC